MSDKNVIARSVTEWSDEAIQGIDILTLDRFVGVRYRSHLLAMTN